jgi:hypothetical protein
MQNTVEQPKSKHSSIYAPPEFKEKIKYLSEKTGKPQWKILLEALALYETSLRKPRAKEELPIVDKVVWYIEKLCMSVGALKENPSDANLQKTMKTVSQIRERLGVNTSLLEKAVQDYVSVVKRLPEDPAEKHVALDEFTIELNMALKSVLIEIVYRYILKEELPQQQEQQR